ncbi:cyclophilin-like domain-containing protein [Spinellus fusiger]|nr:cyclophilin-like domain-containing protein [Spinellus fusiger]
MPREVFLDIALGDIATHQDECARFKLAQDWVSRWGSTYGFESSDIQQLSTTEKDTLRDILANDPSAQKEAWMIDAPKPLGGGRIVIELFDKECPKTCDNFTALCQGGRVSKSSKKPLHYKSTHMFRLVPQFMVQGGDVTRGNVQRVGCYVQRILFRGWIWRRQYL